ncbi:hypothetical protein TNCV_2663011 [Trichonephila clavipes]|nr:hypothetical protein TNCV_2663011 [Trichonephila clavipes]
MEKGISVIASSSSRRSPSRRSPLRNTHSSSVIIERCPSPDIGSVRWKSKSEESLFFPFNKARVHSSAGLSIGRLERAPKGPDKLDLIRFSGYKFRSSSAQRACRSSAPRARNELKSTLMHNMQREY